MNKVKVFRSGIVAAPAQRGCEAEVYAAVDARRPEGHPTRTHGIFAAPQIEGVVRWYRGNHFANFDDIAVREVTVDADAVMVYRINNWERASSVYDWGREDMFSEATGRYFGESMTLTTWLAGEYDPSEWEVIFPAEAVLGVRNVSIARLMAATDSEYTAKEVKDIHRRHARR